MARLLLDESIPKGLAHYFPKSFKVFTVPQMGWAGYSDRRLITLAAAHAFSAFITADRGIEHQQSLEGLAVRIIVLQSRRTHLRYLTPMIPRLIELLEHEPDSGFYRVSG